jgi:hypothetical protein
MFDKPRMAIAPYQLLLRKYQRLSAEYIEYLNAIVTIRNVQSSPVDMLYSSYMPLNMDFSEYFYHLKPRAITQILEASGATGFAAHFFYVDTPLPDFLDTAEVLPKLWILERSLADKTIVLDPSYAKIPAIYEGALDKDILQGPAFQGYGSYVLYQENKIKQL